MAAKDGDKVKVHYTGKLSDGKVFDSSVEREPMEFTIGKSEVIPGFEKAVIGMEQGDSKTFTIACDDAYGKSSDDRMMTVALKDINLDFNPKVGDFLTLQRQDGGQIQVKVVAIDETNISLDANHPLADQDLTFDVTLEQIA